MLPGGEVVMRGLIGMFLLSSSCTFFLAPTCDDASCPDGTRCGEGGLCEPGCDEDAECPEGRACFRSGVCEEGCEDSTDCAVGTYCDIYGGEGTCERGCEGNSDCAEDDVCQYDRCESRCVSSRCPDGLTCDREYNECKSYCNGNIDCQPGYYCDGFDCVF